MTLFRPASVSLNVGRNVCSGYDANGKNFWLVDIRKKNTVLEEFTFKVSNEQKTPVLVMSEVRFSTHIGKDMSSKDVSLFQNPQSTAVHVLTENVRNLPLKGELENTK